MGKKVSGYHRTVYEKFYSCILLIYLSVWQIHAQTSTNFQYDNYRKEYVLTSMTAARIEAGRTHRQLLCDYRPSGLYVKRGETISINVGDLNRDYNLFSMIGFKPMGNNHNRVQEDLLKSGANAVTAMQDGILSFIFVKREGYDFKPITVKVTVAGGKAFPLYVLNKSNLANWEKDVRTMTDAQYVQMVSDKALITLPYRDYIKSPTSNIIESFNTIHKVIDWEDELAGFNNSCAENMRTNNRINFLVDVYAAAEEQKPYYMYATSYFIGLKRDNFTDLTNNLCESTVKV